MPDPGFDDLVAEKTSTGFISRAWLAGSLRQHAAESRYTLLLGEPGAGKTTVLAGLARDNPDWLRYFVRRDSVTSLVGADLTTFLLEIGHQLARSRPALFETQKLEIAVRQKIRSTGPNSSVTGIRIDDLVASPFHRTARLTVSQDVRRLEGELAGVSVGRAYVEPRLLEPGNLAELALFAPAAVLAQEDPSARIVILIDALDELAGNSGGGLLDWLIRGPALPENVHLVLAARPNTELGGLRAAHPSLVTVAIDPRAAPVRKDLEDFARRNLMAEQVRAAVPDIDGFIDTVVGRSAGNFLYLAAYTRAVLDAGMLDIPEGLRGMYGFFLERIRRDIGALGQVELTDGSWTAAWESVGQAVLGILTVARAGLTPGDIRRLAGIPVSARVLGNVLDRMRWILSERDGRYAFFHASVAEFLGSSSVEPLEWHRRIVRACSDIDWAAAGDYELVHLAGHMVSADYGSRVPALVQRDLRMAIRARFGNDRHFMDVVDLALSVAGADLPLTLYLSVVARQLRRGAGKLSPMVLGLLARMGRVDEAVSHAMALGASERQVEALAQIAGFAADPAVVEMLVESAITVGSASALTRAAVGLAPYDLDRALRLSRRSGGEPDRVYAAAIRADPSKAAALLPEMGAGRTEACLELAFSAADPIPLVRLGYESLGNGSDRIAALAQMARFDRAYLRLVATERERLDPENNHPHMVALFLAASSLAPVDARLARSLVGSVKRPSVEQATAWIVLGETSKARKVLRTFLSRSKQPRDRVAAAEAMVLIDPKEAQKLIDGVLAEVESTAPAGDMITSMFQAGLIERLVVYLASRDPERAEALARPDHLAELAMVFFTLGRTDDATRLVNALLAGSLEAPLPEPELGTPAIPAGESRSGGIGAVTLVMLATNLRNQWSARLRRRLYTDPAELARAYAPGPSSVGSPYSWARTLRVFATTLSGPDFGAARELARHIADPGERLVVRGALFTAAPSDHQSRWREFQQALDDLPRWEWALPGDSLDQDFAAYLRPDLRARFDAGIAIMPYETDPGMRLVAGLDTLSYLFQMSFAGHASNTYLRQLVARVEPQEELRQMHGMVASSPVGTIPDPLIDSVVRAIISRNERLITGREMEISDPIYRLLDRTTPEPLGPGLPPDVTIDPQRRPALAGVVLRNRENPAIGRLAEHLLAGADYETRVILARAGFGDAQALIAELLPRLDDMFFVDRDDLLPDFAALIFREAPAEAAQLLSKAVQTRWKTAAAILEYAAAEIIAANGPGIGAKLNESLFAAFACCALGDAPQTIDGVINPGSRK